VKADSITAAQAILLAGAALAANGKREFTEWDLTISAWQRDKNRFGLRGYEDQHPDHKRVMTEIMGQTKKDNPLRRGWFEKTGTNRYSITPLGISEAERLDARSSQKGVTIRSPQKIYDTIEPYVFHKVFLDYVRDPNEPRTWLGAAAFLSLSQNTATVLNTRLRTVESAVTQALGWMDEENQDTLIRGPIGGSRTVRRVDVEKLREFIGLLQRRFAAQIASIQKKK
jgi:hypothetical protein